MASMRKKKDHYYARFYDRARSPKRKEVALRTTRKDVARRRLTEMEKKYERGEFDPWQPDSSAPQPLSIEEAAEQFLKAKQHLRPKSIRAYRLATEGLLKHTPAGLRLADVQAEHVRPYVKASDVSNATQRHRLRHLKAFFNWAQDQGLIRSNPCEKIRVPKKKKKVPEFLTPRQVERLITAIEWDYEEKRERGCIREGHIIWLRDVVKFALGTGLRLGEITNLRWRDVDLESGFVRVRSDDSFQSKSGHERRVPLVGDALGVVKQLDRERTGAGYVFTGYEGSKLNDLYVSKKFRQYRRLAKLPESLSFHNLRYSCASWMVMQGRPDLSRAARLRPQRHSGYSALCAPGTGRDEEGHARDIRRLRPLRGDLWGTAVPHIFPTELPLRANRRISVRNGRPPQKCKNPLKSPFPAR